MMNKDCVHDINYTHDHENYIIYTCMQNFMLNMILEDYYKNL